MSVLWVELIIQKKCKDLDGELRLAHAAGVGSAQTAQTARYKLKNPILAVGDTKNPQISDDLYFTTQ